MSESPKKIVFFPNLDGLRFFAFFSVFLAHSFYTTNQLFLNSEIYKNVVFITSRGILGVNFFFVLSGFLITYLLLVEKEKNGTVNVKYFYFRRFLRIWPLYYAVVLFGFFVLPVVYFLVGKDLITPGEIFLYLTFLSNFDKTTTTAILGVLWSISVEEQFYLVWPLLFRYVRSRHHVLIFFVIILVSFVFRIVYEDNSDVLFKHTLSCISDMAVGGLGAYWSFKGVITDRFKRMPRWTIIAVYIVGAVLIITRSYWNTAFYGLYGSERLIYSVFFLFIVLEQNYSDNSLFKMGNRKWISKLGIYTYGLYMLHFVAIYFVNLIFDMRGWNTNLGQLMMFEPLITFAVTVGLAYASFVILERPFLKIKKRYSYIVKS